MLQRYITPERFERGIVASTETLFEKACACWATTFFFIWVAVMGSYPVIWIETRSVCDNVLPLVQEVDCFPSEAIAKDALHHLSGCDLTANTVGAFSMFNSSRLKVHHAAFNETVTISILGNLSSGKVRAWEARTWESSNEVDLLVFSKGETSAATMLQQKREKYSISLLLTTVTWGFFFSLPWASGAFFPGRTTSIWGATILFFLAISLFGVVGVLISIASLALLVRQQSSHNNDPELLKIIPISAAALSASVFTSMLSYMLGLGAALFVSLGVTILVLYVIRFEWCAGAQEIVAQFWSEMTTGSATVTASASEPLLVTSAEGATETRSSATFWGMFAGSSEPPVEPSVVPEVSAADSAMATTPAGSTPMFRYFAVGTMAGLAAGVVLLLGVSAVSVLSQEDGVSSSRSLWHG